ncbi:MAG: FxLYD domain-containing protein [Dehalococcoidales bacterium]|nr:hypothetical protein [Dehalococcoidales bacterium]
MDKKAKDESKETVKKPEQDVPEENKIAILGHNIFKEDDKSGGSNIVVELNIKNVIDKTVGSVVFEAEFSDRDGNVVDVVEQKSSSIGSNGERTVRLVHKEDVNKPVVNYSVKVRDIVMVPDPVATGNDMVLMTKHNLKYMDNAMLEGVECGIKNISEKIIATLIIECTFFNSEGNVLGTTQHKETDLLPGKSRGVMVQPPLTVPGFMIQSYNIRVLRVITADIEKVQVIKSEMKTVGGEKEVTLTCKNISTEKADVAVIINFVNDNGETVGTKVIPVKDMEANTTRQFKLTFKPLSGDSVKKHEITIGDLVE